MKGISEIDKFILGIVVGIGIMVFLSAMLIGCNGITDKSAMRLYSDISGEQYHYLDNESIALAESASDTGLRAEALVAYNEINDIRAEAGLDELSWDINLETVANVRAKECSQKFSHTRPSGQPWYTVNSKIQGGENLAYGFDNADDCVNAWMNSPSHRDNILYDEFEKIAISIYEEDGTYYWANQFSY